MSQEHRSSFNMPSAPPPKYHNDPRVASPIENIAKGLAKALAPAIAKLTPEQREQLRNMPPENWERTATIITTANHPEGMDKPMRDLFKHASLDPKDAITYTPGVFTGSSLPFKPEGCGGTREIKQLVPGGHGDASDVIVDACPGCQHCNPGPES